MAAKKNDVICAGEIFLLAENNTAMDALQLSIFGMPVLAMLLSVLKNKVAYIGSVGKDDLGNQIIDRFNKFKVNTSAVKQRPSPTSIVLSNASSSRQAHYRKADKLITLGQIKPTQLKQAKIFHTSYAGLSLDPARLSIYRATELALEGYATICLDMNYEKDLWKKRKKGRRAMEKYLSFGAQVLLSVSDYSNIFKEKAKSAEKIINHLLELGATGVSLIVPEHGIWCADQFNETFLKRTPSKAANHEYERQAYWAGYLTGLINLQSMITNAKIGRAMMDYQLDTNTKEMKTMDWKKIKLK